MKSNTHRSFPHIIAIPRILLTSRQPYNISKQKHLSLRSGSFHGELDLFWPLPTPPLCSGGTPLTKRLRRGAHDPRCTRTPSIGSTPQSGRSLTDSSRTPPRPSGAKMRYPEKGATVPLAPALQRQALHPEAESSAVSVFAVHEFCYRV